MTTEEIQAQSLTIQKWSIGLQILGLVSTIAIFMFMNREDS